MTTHFLQLGHNSWAFATYFSPFFSLFEHKRETDCPSTEYTVYPLVTGIFEAQAIAVRHVLVLFHTTSTWYRKIDHCQSLDRSISPSRSEKMNQWCFAREITTSLVVARWFFSLLWDKVQSQGGASVDEKTFRLIRSAPRRNVIKTLWVEGTMTRRTYKFNHQSSRSTISHQSSIKITV